MGDQSLGSSLVASLEAARQRESPLWPALRDDDEADGGGWRPKDHIAHLAAWRDWAAQLLRAARTGEEPPPQGANEDAENAAIFARTRDLPPAEVRRWAGMSYDQLIAEINAGTEEDLHRPRPHSPDREVWSAVPGNGHHHLAEHLAFMAQHRGDDEAAEAAQVWAHEVVFATFADSNSRAHADYDLGCWYARLGQAAKALPYLSAALASSSHLRAWAAQDSDLDPIRASSALKALIEG